MDSVENPGETNKRELMEFYGFKGKIGEIQLKLKINKNFFCQFLASLSPYPLTNKFHRMKGVEIGKHVFIGPNVYTDNVYPKLVTIEDYVTIGMGSMIFAHSNPTSSVWIKKHHYPRETGQVVIKKGSWIATRVTILCGVTVGENSVVGAHSLVVNNVEPYTVVAGVPAKVIKRL